jgi:PTS system D-glucosamine-specific IIC component
MIFGLPGAALAMWRCARSEKRKVAGGLLLGAALTSVLTGITEPLEFTFLFVAPLLYVIHCVLAGLSYMIMHILGVGVGMTFSGGFIDLTLFGILQGNAKTNWVHILWVGAIYFVVYYFLFGFLIRKFNYKTPGREDVEGEVKLYTRADYNAKREGEAASAEEISSSETQGAHESGSLAELIVESLGGAENIKNLDSCATRLRVTVADPEKVSEAGLKKGGALGVIKKGEGVQVIYGPRVTVIKSEVEEWLGNH